MTRTYRIRRVEDDSAFVDLRSMLRSVFGMARHPAPPESRSPVGVVSFAAIFGKRMVGSISLQRPEASPDAESGWHGDAPTVLSLDVDAEHRDSGCREALLDVALQWARANDFQSLEVVLPARRASEAAFYLCNGFHIAGIAQEPAGDSSSMVLAVRLADARPHTDTWYSKHHGAWFATVARH